MAHFPTDRSERGCEGPSDTTLPSSIEHNFRSAPGTESAGRGLRAGVLEGSEQHVPEREIGVVVAMPATQMMDAMAFGPLDQISQPMGRPDVPMVEELGDAR